MRRQQRALAKLTLSLRVTGVRDDGLHLLDAEMVTLDLADTLTFDEGDGLDGLEVVGAHLPPDDLVTRALRAVGRRARVRLDKRIPIGAGLGGGSADAAAVLRWAGCTDVQVAVGLGADVPFCVVGGRARVRGVGDIVEPLPFVDATYTLLTPPFPVSTPAVYRAWDALGGRPAARTTSNRPPWSWSRACRSGGTAWATPRDWFPCWRAAAAPGSLRAPTQG